MSTAERSRTAVVNFLLEVVPPLISCARSDLQSVLLEGNRNGGVDKLDNFITDVGSRTLVVGQEIVLKKVTPGRNVPEGEDDEPEKKLFIASDIDKKATVSSSVCFTKRPNVGSLLRDSAEDGEPGVVRNLGEQLQVMVLGFSDQETSVFELVGNYLQANVDPLFRMHDAEGDQADESAGTGNLPNVRKKLMEFVASVQQAQQSAVIPIITFNVDPWVVEAVKNAKGKKLEASDFQDKVVDTAFLNALQSGMNKWRRDIGRMTKLERDITSGTSLDEANFWVELEKILISLETQIQNAEVESTLSILRAAKRLFATVSFGNDSGLKPRLEAVSAIAAFMRDLPLHDLMSANTIEQINLAVTNIFSYLRRLKNTPQYDVTRAFSFLETLSRDLMSRLLHILINQRLMAIPQNEFDHVYTCCGDVFNTWDDGVRKFKDVCRDALKKRRTTTVTQKTIFEHLTLKDRLDELSTVRRRHQKLRDVVAKVFVSESRGRDGIGREIQNAFLVFDTVDILDLSMPGQTAWEAAKKTYDEKVDRVEAAITARLRDSLGAAKTATEMFRVFSEFNPLFVRPRIKMAIQQYQSPLMQEVKNDIKKLQMKHQIQYPKTELSEIAQLRDIPPVAGSIIWHKQLEKRLHQSLKRASDILGSEMDQHIDGQKLRSDGEAFARVLNVNTIFENWSKLTKDAYGKIEPTSNVLKVNAIGANKFEIIVNQDESLITLFKEVRFLQNSFRIPFVTKRSAEDNLTVYGVFVQLRETVRSFQQLSLRLELPENRTALKLLSSHLLELRSMLEKVANCRWDSGTLESVVTNFTRQVVILEGKFEDVMSCADVVASCVARLAKVSVPEIEGVLAGIQGCADDLYSGTFSNLEDWQLDVDKRIEEALLSRLETIVRDWTREFTGWPQAGAELIAAESYHEFKVQNQTLMLTPPVVEAKQKWTGELHRSLGLVCNLKRITVGGHLAHRNDGVMRDTTNRHLTSMMDFSVLVASYDAIDATVAKLETHVGTWLRYRCLWDLDFSAVANQLEDNLVSWQQLLNQIRHSRAGLDVVDDESRFGPIVVDHSMVQAKIIGRFDQWHREMLSFFAQRVAGKASQFGSQLRMAKTELEELSEGGSLSFLQGDISNAKLGSELSATVSEFVQKLRKSKEQEEKWANEVSHLSQSEKLLERQRFPFPSNWLWVDRLSGDWGVFCQLLRQLWSLYDHRRGDLRTLVANADRAVQAELEAAYADWTRTKPVTGDTQPDVAMQQLARVELQIKKLREDFDNVAAAKVALELDSGVKATGSLSPEMLEEEVESLKGVWFELKTLYSALDGLRETPWTAVVPKRVRAKLEELQDKVKKIPSKFRQYEAFEQLQSAITLHLQTNALVTEMKTDALKDRHWRKIADALGLLRIANIADLTLGHIWDANIGKHEVLLREIFSQAQGETALEEFLRQVKDTWAEYELEMVLYKNKCKLIKKWDEVLGLLDDHLNSLQSMKLSPHYKIFEEDATSFDEKLNRLRVLLDTWMEVQRKWAYLEGVFTGSADIQALLPNEFSRFRQLDSDFVAIMKKTAQRPRALELASTDGLQRSLERLSELLSKIQKALGEYLEQQRSNFPRFYFVGDEDLLEMIGNSKDPTVVQRHLNKMFAGVTHLVTDEDNVERIIGMGSREGEVVNFIDPVEIMIHKSLNLWLRAVESQMFATMADLLASAYAAFQTLDIHKDGPALFEWVKTYPIQIVMLIMQIDWTSRVDDQLQALKKQAPSEKIGMKQAINRCNHLLVLVADQVLLVSEKIQRTKLVQLITELVHQRDVCRMLEATDVRSPKDFRWLEHMRYYYDTSVETPALRLNVVMANASFIYGFEYLGMSEKLVQTPLTDRCYLTLTQALHFGLGGNPFGPAGTGKTETVKALGCQLGRFVLVFCCDETFDFHSMGRIFVGLCQVGAWGCFDEFNRLEERILSAVSEQILTIQTGLKNHKDEIELLNHPVRLNRAMGIFVTMNPGYAGRSNLPDNLKQLFRECAMIVPDKTLIAQVLLYSHGFRSAERLAGKVVALFDLCLQQLSNQPHYDFGLRSLKSVLASAGNLKRNELLNRSTVLISPASDSELVEAEQRLLLRSICDTLVPKLVAQDVPLLRFLLSGVFPGADIVQAEEEVLREEIGRVCATRHFETPPLWMEKVLQLYHIQRLHHGVMMVGPVGTGKSAAWRVLLEAMERVDGTRGMSHILDPKSVSKEHLYGKLDPTTMEWTDGVFTSLIRRIVYGSGAPTSIAAGKRHWIVFDGDVDPEWAENLNSVLDDNKLLTLPTGERLQIPEYVRIMFEVDTLKSATLATVSRCGMVWFSEDVLPQEAIASHMLNSLAVGPEAATLPVPMPVDRGASQIPMQPEHAGSLEAADIERLIGSAAVHASSVRAGLSVLGGTVLSGGSAVRGLCISTLTPFFSAGGFVLTCLERAATFEHIMSFTKIRCIESLFSLLGNTVRDVEDFAENSAESSGMMTSMKSHIENFITKSLVFMVCWGFGGSMPLSQRTAFCQVVESLALDIKMPGGLDSTTTLLDFEVRIEDGEWHPWRERVASVDVDNRQVQDAQMVVETIDTMRHRAVLAAWLAKRMPFILCGPPGSGKTMTLLSTLKGLTDFDIASLNFSSGSTPELLLKTFDHYCEYVKTTNGVVLRPSQPGKWLIVFCDEINLPSPDRYQTQRVIMFLRQLTECAGFWRIDSFGQWHWVRLERIQFAGACNPPMDAGRHAMSDRFLRHAPLMFVDFPGAESLRQIYGTFNRAMLRNVPSLRPYADALTDSMVEFYLSSQVQFTVDMQPHYIYSPRELTRWKVALFEALRGRDHIELGEVVRLTIHEALRIFQDRLVDQEARDWTDSKINEIICQNFPDIGPQTLVRPIIYSSHLTHHYEEAQREDLRQLVQGKLKVFNEESLNVQLVLFDEVLDHITRIDRVLRQPLGHLLLVGASGAGKTVLSKFVSWLNGLSVFQIKAGRNYDTNAFEADLRTVMKRSGVREEKITFIFDESNVLGPAFLERMNALLAAGEVPGLFEGDEYTQLMAECKVAYGADIGTDEADLFNRFTVQVQRNLHIVFTMNPANPDFQNRQATSPALFNRCVIDWFGDWPHSALVQVAHEFTVDLEVSQDAFAEGMINGDTEMHERLTDAIVCIHECVALQNDRLMRSGKKYNYVTPRDYLDFIRHFKLLMEEKKEATLETAKHLNVGLGKLGETETQVAELQASLTVKEKELAEKNALAEEKMKLMVTQQTEAEENKRQAEALAKELDAQALRIAERRTGVQHELAEVEPLLREAESAVSNIPRRSLDELRSMANPPATVKFAVEAVVVMLNNMGDRATNWEDCRRVLKSGDFISRILSFDSTSTSASTVQRIKSKYTETKDWDIEKIHRASNSAGPLASWVASSISYQVIIQKVDPLRLEIEQLETQQAINQQKLQKNRELVSQLESKLEQYKAEYAQLISDCATIKKEMDSVKSKVLRSMDLLKNLTSEQERWHEASLSSSRQMITSLGDCLLAGAFCTYVGFFEHQDRARLLQDWRFLLTENHIKTRPELSLVEYLSKPSERFQWQANGLPADDLSIENAIVTSRYIRYPLIIDPSGQATSWLVNQYSSKRLVKTSLLDANFMKNLESALRFGTPLLVQDVEKIDPILNSVLNQETHKAGGRVLITVGDSEIDFSPSFTLFLATRDPTIQFTPDLCSRVTFVNFTLTPSSLQNQCLNAVLKSERPDVDSRRSDMLKLQGEFRVKMRDLEDKLLFALSNVQGNILDDDKVLATLEHLKAQAADVELEAAQTDLVMEEVDKTCTDYLPFAEAASRVFFTLQHLQSLHFLYHYDLVFFEGAFQATLKDELLSKIKSGDFKARLATLLQQLFWNVYQRCATGCLFEHRVVLALQLARIRFESQLNVSMACPELDLLLQGHLIGMSGDETEPESETMTQLLGGLLNAESYKALKGLCALPCFSNIMGHVRSNEVQWITFISSNQPEHEIPRDCVNELVDRPLMKKFEDRGLAEKEQALCRDLLSSTRDALVIKAFRPDRLPSVLTRIAEMILGDNFLQSPPLGQDEFNEIISRRSKANVPVVLVSGPGFDPSSRVVEAAKKLGRHLTSIAMGSEEGYKAADQAILSASRQGTWVLLKNVHLSSGWLHELEKNLFRLQMNEKFRIYLTMEFHPAVPRNLLRVSLKFVFDPPAGLKASMHRTLTQIASPQRSERKPAAARCRLHFLLAFLNAVIVERKRYSPFGWTKQYEFSDADQSCALEIIDQWLDSVAGGSDSVDPQRIPWKALQTLLADVAFGGRLDNEVDSRVLKSFVNHLFQPLSFETDFCLMSVESEGVLKAPDLGRSLGHYTQWVEKLQAEDKPTWLGFAPNADRVISARHGMDSLVKWFTLHSKAAEELHDLQPSASVFSTSSMRSTTFEGSSPHRLQSMRSSTLVKPTISRRGSLAAQGWVAELAAPVAAMLSHLPGQIRPLTRTSDRVEDSLFRYCEREVSLTVRQLDTIRADLSRLQDICAGTAKFTNYLRDLARHISRSETPPSWVIGGLKADISCTEWLYDFGHRVVQLGLISMEYGGGPEDQHTLEFQREGKRLSAAAFSPCVSPAKNGFDSHHIWLGGMAYPKAFLTATQQTVARKLGCSLDDLALKFEIGETISDDTSFILAGMTIEGAGWDPVDKKLCLSDVLATTVPPARLSWSMDKSNTSTTVAVPLFWTKARRDEICMVRLPIPDGVGIATWHQRGTALIIWNQI